MKTQIVPGVQAVGVSPEHEFTIKQANSSGFVGHFGGLGDYMPIVQQNGIVDHSL